MKKSVSLCLIFLLVMTSSLAGCSKKDKNDSTSVEDTYVEQATENYTTKAGSLEADLSFDAAASSERKDGEITFSADESMSTSQDTMNKYGNFANPNLPNTEEFSEITEVGFKDTSVNPLSTFSIDVDTASYTNLRKNLSNGIIPEADAVRIEEMLNYFTYDYSEPSGDQLFSINTEIGKCPWNEDNYLLTVGILGKNVDTNSLPKSNLVFLIDVSGSMEEPDKLPLLINAFSQLVEVLTENDKVSIVVYAGRSGVVLDSVRGNEKDTILDSLESLEAGGSTGGAGGIELAYRLAEENFIKDGNNRVILATDGDFNVGPSSPEELENIIEEKRESGIFLSVIGFGSGNLKDNKMEILADKGNGNYSYIDSSREAKKVLVDEMAGTLLTIAKDVKIQLEFNPSSVAGYRLIGYENRALQDEDFKDDTIDAGELGAGHRVTAVYEISPAHTSSKDEDLKYQSEKTEVSSEYKNEISEIRLRYKEPDGEVSREIKKVVTFENTPVNGRSFSKDFYFAAAVVEFGMILRNSEYKGDASIESVLALAEQGLDKDENGYRMEFLDLAYRYQELLGYRW
ncbi:MAG: vWA domain-containing protein [Mobilitalea sp.]